MEAGPASGQKTVENPRHRQQNGGSVLSVIQSVLAAALGVQSSKNRDRDFSEGSPRHFIIAGLLFCLLLVGTLVAVVQWITTG